MNKKEADEIYLKRGEYHVVAYANDQPFKDYVDSVLTFFADKKGQTILDAGAGEGLMTELLKDAGHTVDALDISVITRRQFIKRTKNKWSNPPHFFARSLENFRQKYDWILCANTLVWIRDDEAAAKKIKKLAKVGVYVTVPPEAWGEYDMRGYTQERLQKMFPGAEIYLQHDLRWVVIWRR